LLALLKTIAAFGGVDVSQDKVIDALWPEEDGDAAHQSFTTALHRLRKLLGDHDLIIQRAGKLTLNPQQVWVDALAFDRLCGLAQAAAKAGDVPAHCAHASQAIDLYGGSFLPGEVGHTWAMPLQERLRMRFVDLISAVGLQLESEGRGEQALALYRRGIEADELAEVFYQGIIRCLCRDGRAADAALIYQRMRERLSLALGVPPSPATEALYRNLTSGRLK